MTDIEIITAELKKYEKENKQSAEDFIKHNPDILQSYLNVIQMVREIDCRKENTNNQ